MEYDVDLLPKVKIETVIPNNRVEEVAESMAAAARTGKIGDGQIFIYAVLEAVRIRNGDSGEAAL